MSQLNLVFKRDIFSLDKSALSFHINACDKLHTKFKPQRSECQITVKNLTFSYMAFRVLTTKKEDYEVNPSYCIINPDETKEIQFIFYLKSSSLAPSEHKFKFQGILIDNASSKKSPKSLFENFTKLNHPVEGKSIKIGIEYIIGEDLAEDNETIPEDFHQENQENHEDHKDLESQRSDAATHGEKILEREHEIDSVFSCVQENCSKEGSKLEISPLKLRSGPPQVFMTPNGKKNNEEERFSTNERFSTSCGEKNPANDEIRGSVRESINKSESKGPMSDEKEGRKMRIIFSLAFLAVFIAAAVRYYQFTQCPERCLQECPRVKD